MSNDTVFLLQAFVIGVAITFTYDWLRILRQVIPHRQFFISFEDFWFWLICALSVFIWMYRISNGGMRWFAIIGALLGMYLYKKLFSRVLVTGLSHVLEFVLRILGGTLKFLLRPVYLIVRRIKGLQKKAGEHRTKIYRNFKMWLKSKLKALKIRLCKR